MFVGKYLLHAVTLVLYFEDANGNINWGWGGSFIGGEVRAERRM